MLHEWPGDWRGTGLGQRSAELAQLGRETTDMVLSNRSDLSASDWRDLESLCAQFEHEIRSGSNPVIETFLDTASPKLNGVAFEEMLATEFEVSLERREEIDTSTYLSRFPTLGSVIEAVLSEVTQAFEQKCSEPQREESAETPDTERTNGDHAKAMPDIPGFEILGELGRGGMGVVYRARDIKLKRIVALKMILMGEHADPESVKRFRTEAEIIARLHHQNIVQVFEVGEANGQPFLVLELVEGGSLADLCIDQPQPSRFAARLVQQLAVATHYAHQQGVIHRDLKPGNILLQRKSDFTGTFDNATMHGTDGTTSSPQMNGSDASTLNEDAELIPKIVDFGLAKHLAGDGTQTSMGRVLGTPQYMSPEQARGDIQSIGLSSDVYSLGAVLYALITGRAPFQADSPVQVLLQVQTEQPPPPTGFALHLPIDLQTICLKCLEKEPRKRYLTAADLADDLTRFLRHEPILARPAGNVERVIKFALRRKAFSALLAVLALVFIVGLPVMFALYVTSERHREDAETARGKAENEARLARASNARTNNQLSRLHEANGIRLLDSGDGFGALVYFSESLRLGLEAASAGNADAVGRLECSRMRLAVLQQELPSLVRQWTREAPATSVDFSPDGNRVSLAITDGTDSTVEILDVVSGEPILPPIRHKGAATRTRFSSDGQLILSASSDHVCRIWRAIDGQDLSTLRHNGPVNDAAFGPASALVATASDDSTARIWDAESGQPVTGPMSHPAPVERILFSNDGKLVATLSNSEGYVWEVETGLLRRKASHMRRAEHICFSPDSGSVATSGMASAWTWSTKSTKTTPLQVWHDLSVDTVQFSPSGNRLLTTMAGSAVWQWNASTGRIVSRPMLHPGENINEAIYSPDGRFVATSSDDHKARIWDVETSRLAYPPFNHPSSIKRIMFSASGRRLLTLSGKSLVRVWDLASGAPFRQRFGHRDAVRTANFRPDGQQLVTASDDRTARVWDVASGIQVGSPIQHESEVTFAEFSPNTSKILTVARDGRARVWDAQTRAPIELPTDNVRRAVFSPDSKHVLILEPAIGKINISTSDIVIPFSKEEKFLALSADRTRVALQTSTSVHVLDVTSGKRKTSIDRKFFKDIEHITFSSDASQLVCCSRQGMTQVIDVSPVQVTREFFTGRTIGIVCSANDKYLATLYRSGTFRIWDLTTGQPVTTLSQHDGLRFVHFSLPSGKDRPGAQYLLSASENGTIRLWDAASGSPITPLLRHDGSIEYPVPQSTRPNSFSPRVPAHVAAPIEFAGFNPTCGAVVSTARDGTVHLWPLPNADAKTPPQLDQLSQVLSVRKPDEHGGLRPLSEASISDVRPIQTNTSLKRIRDWHKRQLAQCSRVRNVFGTQFHTRILSAVDAGHAERYQQQLTSVRQSIGPVLLFDFERPRLSNGGIEDRSRHGLIGNLVLIDGGRFELTGGVPSLAPQRQRALRLFNRNKGSCLLSCELPLSVVNLCRDSWSFSGWFSTRTSDRNEVIFHFGQGDLFGATDELYLFVQTVPRSLALQNFSNGKMDVNIKGSKNDIKTEQWYFATVVHNHQSRTISLYLNGELLGEDSGFEIAIDQRLPIRFGGTEEANSSARKRWLDGKLDELTIFNYALTKEEVSTAYSNGLRGVKVKQ